MTKYSERIYLPRTTSYNYQIGAGTNPGIGSFASIVTAEEIGALASDDNWQTLQEDDTAGSIKLLYFRSVSGNYTSGDVFKIKLTLDDNEVALSVVTVTTSNYGAVVVGGCTFDTAFYHPVPTGHLPFRKSYKIEQQIIRAGATTTPSVKLIWDEYI